MLHFVRYLRVKLTIAHADNNPTNMEDSNLVRQSTATFESEVFGSAPPLLSR